MPEDVVRAFLRDVRSGARLQSAPQYLAPQVWAHQGPPGSGAVVLARTPEQYAEHVRDMLLRLGPWRFDVLDVALDPAGPPDTVCAAWRQVSRQRPADGGQGLRYVELGRAVYRVVDRRIAEYWIDIATTACATDG